MLICFWVYIYARTKGKQEQYKKARNSFLNSKIDTICDKLAELESKHGETPKESRCVQFNEYTMKILKRIDLNITSVGIMVTESRIKECE